MSATVCSHPRGDDSRRMCAHLLADDEISFYYRFTGRGVEHALVCKACVEAPLESLETVCQACFVERQWSIFDVEGFIGAPEVLSRPTALRFEHREIAVPALVNTTLRAIAPHPDPSRLLWIGVTDRGDLVRLDLVAGTVDGISSLSGSQVQLDGAPGTGGAGRDADPTRVDRAIGLQISPCGRFAAVFERRGSHGAIVDLAAGTVTMTLYRGGYHEDVCDYSVAFFRDGGRTLLVHATDWNRLDISEPGTGALLTPRDTSWAQGAPRPPHHLDYFHSGLTVSPGGRWLVDDGWVWHPVGVLQALDLQRWTHQNVWESEDGQSLMAIRRAAYFWDAPRCFVESDVLAVGGFGVDDESMIDGALLFDLRSGKMLRWFAGPSRRGTFVFDEYLFATDARDGTSVWDVATGERICHDPRFTPGAYHPGARRFLTLGRGGEVRVSQLTDGASG